MWVLWVRKTERVGGVVAAAERNGGRVRPTARERGQSAMGMIVRVK